MIARALEDAVTVVDYSPANVALDEVDEAHSDPDESRDDELEEVATSPLALRITRLAAFVVTAGIAVASFVLSFDALSDLAQRAGYSHGHAPLWPISVDGTMLASTIALLALSPYGDLQKANRRFFWWTLGIAAAVSIVANGLHAIIPVGAPLNPWLKAAIGTVPAAALLVTAHGAGLLSRVRPLKPKSVQVQRVVQRPAPTGPVGAAASDRREYWLGVAEATQLENPNRRSLVSRDPAILADVLERHHDQNESQRSISKQTALHHDTVRTIVEAGTSVMEKLEAPRTVAVATT